MIDWNSLLEWLAGKASMNELLLFVLFVCLLLGGAVIIGLWE